MQKGNRPHAVASGARGRPGRLGRVLPALPCGPRLAAAGQPHRAPAPPRIPIAVLPLLRASPCGLSQCTSCSPEQKPRASAGRPPTDRPASPWQAALQSRQTVRGEGCHVSGGCGSWSFSFSISSSNESSGLISFRIDWFGLLLSKKFSRVFSSTMVQKHQFFGTQLSAYFVCLGVIDNSQELSTNKTLLCVFTSLCPLIYTKRVRSGYILTVGL